MNIITRGEEGFAAPWDGFLAAERLGPLYRRDYLDFQVAASAGRHIADASFVVADRGRALAVAPLLVERGGFGPQVARRGGFLPAPVLAAGLPERVRKQAAEAAEARLAELVRRHGIVMQFSLVDALSLAHRPEDLWNDLLQRGSSLELSLNTRIIDLRPGPGALWPGLRKSYKGLVRQAEQGMSVRCLGGPSCAAADLAAFRGLYRLAAGRELYDDPTWDTLFGLLARDGGLLVLAERGGQGVGGAVFLHAGAKAYYAMAANDPALERELPIGHLCLWTAIRHYAAAGVHWLETGWQYGGPQLLEPVSDKDRAIAFFKAGFGGRTWPVYRAVRFFDAAAARAFVERRVAQWLAGQAAHQDPW